MGGSNFWDIILYYIGGVNKVTTSAEIKTSAKPEIAPTRNYAVFMNIQQYVNLPFEMNNTNILAITLIAQTIFWLLSIYRRRREKQLVDENIKKHHEADESPTTLMLKSSAPLLAIDNGTPTYNQLNEQLNQFKTPEMFLSCLNVMNSANNQPTKYTKQQNINTWLLKLENFFTTNKIVQKVSNTLAYLDNECLDIVNQYRKLKMIDDYETLKSALIEIFKQNSNDTISEASFYGRKQQPKETPMLFYLELCKLAEAAFVDIKDSVKQKRIITQLINNLEDNRITRALFLEPITTVENIMNRIQNIKNNFINYTATDQYEYTPIRETVTFAMTHSSEPNNYQRNYQTNTSYSQSNQHKNNYTPNYTNTNSYQNQYQHDANPSNNYIRYNNQPSLNNQQVANKYKPRSNPQQCNYCKEIGHWARDCLVRANDYSTPQYTPQQTNNQQSNNQQPISQQSNNQQTNNYGRTVNPEQQSSAFAMRTYQKEKEPNQQVEMKNNLINQSQPPAQQQKQQIVENKKINQSTATMFNQLDPTVQSNYHIDNEFYNSLLG